MLIAECHPVLLSPGERCECFLQQSKLNTSDLFKFLACEKWPSGNSLRSLPSAWIYVQWIYMHSCRQLTQEGEKQNQDLCFGKQEVQDLACQNQIIRSVAIMKALVKQLGRQRAWKNDAVMSRVALSSSSTLSPLGNCKIMCQSGRSIFRPIPLLPDVILHVNTAPTRDQAMLVINYGTRV